MLRLYIYPLLVIIYIITQITPSPLLDFLVGILANLAIIVSLFYARGLYFYSGITFYIVGIILFFSNDLTWHDFLLQFDSMLGILSLFIMLPFLNSLILVGRYDKHLSSLLEYRINHVGDLFQRGGIVTYILGLFLNIATIPLVLHTLHKTLRQYSATFTDKFYTRSILRAYAFCLMWSPMEIMIIQSLDITQVNYLTIFPILILFSSIIFLFHIKLGKRKYSDYPVQTNNTTKVSLKTVISKIYELFILLILLVVIVTVVDYFLDEGYLFSLVLLIIPISILWAFKLKKVKSYFVYTIPHFKTRTKGLANFFFMFLSAGFFVNMIGETKLLSYLQSLFINLNDHIFILFICIGLYFFITSFIGFHPLVSIILLAEIISPILPDVSGIPLAFVLIICSLTTVIYSPFNVSLSILATELNQNSFLISFWNTAYSLLLMGIAIVVGYGLHLIFT